MMGSFNNGDNITKIDCWNCLKCNEVSFTQKIIDEDRHRLCSKWQWMIEYLALSIEGKRLLDMKITWSVSINGLFIIEMNHHSDNYYECGYIIVKHINHVLAPFY